VSATAGTAAPMQYVLLAFPPVVTGN
jgi:hypothetical protein